MSLLSEIFEQLEFERLLEEGKDPRELLHYKYQYVPSQVIDALIDIDPTKKKSYTQWVLSNWKDEAETIVDNLKNGRIAKLFDHYRNHQDIQIKDCPSVEEGLRAYVPMEDTVLSKSSEPMTYVENLGKEVPSELANDFDIVFDEDNWIIAVPNTYEAECKLGENMKWCTANAYGNGLGYYNQYLSEGGKFYVNFDMSMGESRGGKDYPFTRYQFHFESRQFMDKEDDPVNFDDIGLPQGAIRYYESEGYDPSEFENEEARIERYEEQRNEAYFDLNDELYLCVEYDDNYEYREPNENTPFYVFDENDSRDPIDWEEIPNPFTNNDVVVINKDEYVILKTKSEGEYLLVLKDNTSRNYRSWATYNLTKFIELPYDVGVFGLTNERHYGAFTAYDNTSDDFKYLTVNDCESMSVNEYCTKADENEYDRLFIETINDGYHSLFAISEYGGFECVIKRDIPINGESYFINENGIIEGRFRNYRAYQEGDFEYEEDENYLSYDIESELPTSDLLVSQRVTNEYGNNREVYNIIKKGTNRPLIEPWFNHFLHFEANLYIVKYKDKIGYFTTEGEQVGEWYGSYGGIDKENGIVAGYIHNGNSSSYTIRVDIINGMQGAVIGSFKNLLNHRGFNHKVVVFDNDETTKCFDYVEGKYCFTEFKDWRRIFGSRGYFDNIFFCTLANNSENILFDIMTSRVIARNIKELDKLGIYIHNYLEIKYLDEKTNVFDLTRLTNLLPNNVDKILKFSDDANIIVYMDNGRYFPYDFENNQILINQNGSEFPITITNNNYLTYCSEDGYIDFYVDKGKCELARWSCKDANGGYKSGRDLNRETTPQGVLSMYSSITGQQASVSESFKNMMSRINEVMKLSRMDILD